MPNEEIRKHRMSAVLVSMQWEKAERTYCMCCQAQGLSRDYCMHTCLTYDERFHWLENDDYSKWPGRWFLLPISVLCPLSLSLPICRSTSRLSPNGTAISANAFQTYSSCHVRDESSRPPALVPSLSFSPSFFPSLSPSNTSNQTGWCAKWSTCSTAVIQYV